MHPTRAVPFDFDEFDRWDPQLGAILSDLLPANIRDIVIREDPEFVEDALDIVFCHAERSDVVDRTCAWIRSKPVRGYHATRLTEPERESILRDGLKPLVATDRKTRLTRSLSKHARWSEVATQLDEAVELYGPKQRGGRREGQVHLTVSRAGLTKAFDHYLRQGSEFDWHVSWHLLGEEGQALVAADGEAYLVKVMVPGEMAFEAYNPYGISSDGIPNLVRQVLEIWSYRLAHPDYSSERRRLDCGMIFRQIVPAHWIEAVERFASASSR